MLKRTVPTPAKTLVWTGGVAVALIANTSLSGSEKRTAALQFRPRPSSHRLVLGLNLTISPVSGCRVPSKFVLGAGRPPGAVKKPPVLFPTTHGGALAPSSHTTPSESDVVRFPEWKTAAYTVFPSGLTASARGVSPSSVTMPSRVPAGLNAQTFARPMPG